MPKNSSGDPVPDIISVRTGPFLEVLARWREANPRVPTSEFLREAIEAWARSEKRRAERGGK
jgi:hypothetical protein